MLKQLVVNHLMWDKINQGHSLYKDNSIDVAKDFLEKKNVLHRDINSL